MFARFDPSNLPKVIRCGPMKLGSCYPASVMDMNPFQEIRPYAGPVLIIHGTKDNIVHPDYSRRAAQAYDHAQLIFIEDGAHGFSRRHDEQAIAHLTRFAGSILSCSRG